LKVKEELTKLPFTNPNFTLLKKERLKEAKPT